MNAIIVVDNMMPTILVGHLKRLGYEAQSVRRFGVAGTSDKTIWPKVEDLGAILISKDWDFISLARNSHRGKLIHYRRGNETTAETLAAIEHELPIILQEFAAGKSTVVVS